MKRIVLRGVKLFMLVQIYRRVGKACCVCSQGKMMQQASQKCWQQGKSITSSIPEEAKFFFLLI